VIYPAVILAVVASSALFVDGVDEGAPLAVPVYPEVATICIAPISPTDAAVTVREASVAGLMAATTPAGAPEQIQVIVPKCAPVGIASAILNLADGPAELKAVTARLKTESFTNLRVALYAVDVEAWRKVIDFLTPVPGAKRPWANNWLEVEKGRIWGKIGWQGYSPEALKEVEALMLRAAKPVERGSLNQLNSK